MVHIPGDMSEMGMAAGKRGLERYGLPGVAVTSGLLRTHTTASMP